MSDMSPLLEIMARLRDPKKGCPWDLEQTMQTIVPHTIEEAYELADAIERHQVDEIKKECGDLLFQVIFYAQLAQEQGWFDFHGVCESLYSKLVVRHPHIFGDASISSAKEQSKLWEDIKHKERDSDSLLNDIPKNLPSLSRAQKIQKRVATVGFDWDNISDVIDKIEEEIKEVKEALSQSKERAAEECGDLLFACTNLARWLEQDAEQVLRSASEKFEKRFAQVEAKVKKSNKTWQDYSLQELDSFWKQVKLSESS